MCIGYINYNHSGRHNTPQNTSNRNRRVSLKHQSNIMYLINAY